MSAASASTMDAPIAGPIPRRTLDAPPGLTKRALKRWLLVANGVAIALLSGLLGVSLVVSRDVYLERAGDATTNIAATLSEGFRSDLDRVDLALQTIVHAHRRSLARNAPEHEPLTVIASELKSALPEVDALRITDANGVVRFGTGIDPAVRVEVGDRAYFAAARTNATAGPIISEPVVGRRSKKWVVTVARALRNADGTFAGIVYASLTSDYFASKFARIDVGDAGAISLRSGTMSLIARRTQQGVAGTGIGEANVSDQLRAAIAANPRSGTYVARTAVDQIERANAYERVGDYPLYVIVGLGTSEFLEPWRKQAWAAAALALLLTSVLLGASWFVYASWGRQMAAQQVISRAAERDRALLMTSVDGIHVLSRDGRLVECNDAFVAMLGRERAALQDAHMTNWDADYTSEQLSRWLQSFPLGGTRRSTSRYRRADGVLLDVEITSSAVRLDGVDLIYCSARDMTERNKLQDEIVRGRARAEEDERFLRLITDNAPALMSYVDTDRRFRFANAAYRDWLGVEPESLYGRTLEDVYGKATYESFRRHIDRALTGERVNYERELVGPNGTRHVAVAVVPDVNPAGVIAGLHVLMNDTTQLKQAEQALRQSEARVRAVTDALPMLVAYVDAGERYRFSNQACESAFGVRREAMLGKTVKEVVGDQLYADIEPFVRRALHGETVTFTTEIVTVEAVRYREATYIPEFHEDRASVLGFHAIVNDVTSSRLEERRLRKLTQLDPVTGVANRIGLHERLTQAMQACRASGLPMALLYLDVDCFKHVNDTFGHAVGDELLSAFADRLVQTLRLTDTVGRLGGDEFAVVLERLQVAEHATHIAEKILFAMREPFVLGSNRLSITTSIGIALCNGDETDPHALLNDADKGLYQAKAAGRNTWKASGGSAARS